MVLQLEVKNTYDFLPNQINQRGLTANCFQVGFNRNMPTPLYLIFS